MNKLELLTKTIELAEKRVGEERELEKKYGIHSLEEVEKGLRRMILVPSNEREAEYCDAPRPSAAELESFVKSLSDGEIVYVAAVMYGGRDYWSCKEPHQELVDIIHELKSNHPENVRELIHNILEKEPLAEYLKAGINLYKIT